jgi:hypothetical protein
MAFKVLVSGGSKSFTPHWFNESNSSLTLPTGTTVSANTSDFNIGTAVMSGGNVVFTPQGTNTGNVYVNCIASLPTGQDVFASILVHVTDNTTETTDYGTFTVV